MVKVEMKKTSKSVSIPLNQAALQIMEKYMKQTGSYFPKKISDQKLNEYIKEACSKVDLLHREVVINVTENNARVSKKYFKYELVTTHTMRRSFATNAALEGKLYYAIMAITGHKTERSFLRYIKLDQLDAVKVFHRFWERGQLMAV